MPELSATGRVVLGMLALGKQSGYDIKQLVDMATRHFWAASYGQIYPELKRFEEQGLIVGSAEPSGGRARRVYELTDAGRGVLRDWLLSPEEPLFEFRCEPLLKIFFSDAVGPDTRLDQIRAMRLLTERKLAQLNAIGSPPLAGPATALAFGKAMNSWLIDWCQQAEEKLESEIEGRSA
jgi:DNA-binding PadR family transcriptional regulator